MPDRYGRVVTPVFRETTPGVLGFLGSAVLIEAADHSPWLISAAHVLAEMEHSQLAIAANGDTFFYIVTDGKVVSTCELTPRNAASDPKDLAFVRLLPGMVAAHRQVGPLLADVKQEFRKLLEN